MAEIYTLTLNPALDKELAVEKLAFDAVLRAGEPRIDYGGKGFNVSRALHALGMKNTALGFVGGPTGERLMKGLDALGITTHFVWTSGETRTNISVVPASRARYFKVNEPGPVITADEQTFMLQQIDVLAQPGDWWVLSGSLPRGLPVDFYAEVIRLVQDAGARAVLDTSGDPLRLGIEIGAYLVKPNWDEAAALLGERAMVDMLAAVQEMGAQNVVMSLGEAGAVAYDGETMWQANTPQVEVHNPTGAGDALVAGMVWALNQDAPFSEALRWGVACGAAAASFPGTAMGSRDYVEKLLADVRCEVLR